MRLYIAGPMTGKPEYNFPAFAEAAKDLRAAGYKVLSPAEMDLAEGFDPKHDTAHPWEYYQHRDFAAIEDCNGLAMLPGWEYSQGACDEQKYAHRLGLPTFDVLHWLDHAETILSATPTANSSHEVRVVDPTTGGAKCNKLARFDLIPPDVERELAEHYGKCGGDGSPESRKYDERNWEKGYNHSLSLAAMRRHLNAYEQGEDIDRETGTSHLVCAAWHLFTLRAFQLRGLGSDDLPTRKEA